MDNLKSVEEYESLLLFKVEMTLYNNVNKVIKGQLVSGFLFYSWRDINVASHCLLIEIIQGSANFIVGETKEVIIGVIPSVLSKSFKVGEKLSWGGLDIYLGDLYIKDLIRDIPFEDKRQFATLYRPVNQSELDLIEQLDWERFPPRLSNQPFFYPVLDEEYANQISRDWNVPAYGIGYVVRFKLLKDYFDFFEVKNVGNENHNELWVPSEELDTFNSFIIGKIEKIRKFE
ncbi:hypothetical protein [Dyadobacter sp. CY312]|uniref:hypothetical protein n=1 Tax=Dyadobacter sp. CY312 TaxID=2907303 RepID=UPI001F1C1459|nr:hypothetical protein [Dyadobacter sp. CY312]MCE7043818.1 hypothetical protein [Dyadobacter sp. CY312]